MFSIHIGLNIEIMLSLLYVKLEEYIRSRALFLRLTLYGELLASYKGGSLRSKGNKRDIYVATRGIGRRNLSKER